MRIFIAILVIIAAAGVYLVYQGSSGGYGKTAGNTADMAGTVISESSVSTEDASFEHVFPEKLDGMSLIEETCYGKLYTASYSDGENSGFIH